MSEEKKASAEKPTEKPAEKPAVAKPTVKSKGKKPSFVCKTCKQSFAGGRALGSHYDANPTHRIKPAGKKAKGAGKGSGKVAESVKGKPFYPAGIPKHFDYIVGDVLKISITQIENEIAKLQRAKEALYEIIGL